MWLGKGLTSFWDAPCEADGHGTQSRKYGRKFQGSRPSSNPQLLSFQGLVDPICPLSTDPSLHLNTLPFYTLLLVLWFNSTKGCRLSLLDFCCYQADFLLICLMNGTAVQRMTEDISFKQGQRVCPADFKITSELLLLLRKRLPKNLQKLSLNDTEKCYLTLKGVNHSEKCKREGGFSTACSAADPNLWHRKQMNIRQWKYRKWTTSVLDTSNERVEELFWLTRSSSPADGSVKLNQPLRNRWVHFLSFRGLSI